MYGVRQIDCQLETYTNICGKVKKKLNDFSICYYLSL